MWKGNEYFLELMAKIETEFLLSFLVNMDSNKINIVWNAIYILSRVLQFSCSSLI